MRRGLPLDDADRAGWLATLAAILHSHPPSAPPLFLACSALKHAYRDSLQAANPARISFAFLNAPPELIRNRLQQRHTAGSHFMPPALLDSQLATLEPPTGAITLDASLPPALLADQLLAKLTIPY
jgi:gluconokinase